VEKEKIYVCAIFSFCRYSGEMREIGAYLDEVANILWDNVSTILSCVASSVLILFKFKQQNSDVQQNNCGMSIFAVTTTYTITNIYCV
jgi:hypothetical protein